MLSEIENSHKLDKNDKQAVSKSTNIIDYNPASNSTGIKTLPVEVLARIFVLGEGILRGPRASGRAYVGFQDLVTQVCRRWRDIAISTPILWAYIFISQPPPYLLAQCYIDRSGSRPLIIDIDMGANGIEPSIRLDPQLQTKRVLETFEFIVACGGTFDRWKSLIISSKLAPVIFDIISFIGSTPTPDLQFLSLTWNFFSERERWVQIREQDAMAHAQSHAGDADTYSLVHGPLRSRLRHVHLNRFPSDFTFDRSGPQFSHLTTFTFSSVRAGSCPMIQGFSALLSANPQLESISLDACGPGYDVDYPVPTPLAPLQVRLPLLRSFSLGNFVDALWILQILQITDAPALEYFKLHVYVPSMDPGEAPGKLFRYLGKGRLNGDLQVEVPPERPTSNYSCIFPSLRHLNIEDIHGDSSMLPVLEAFPSVTRITLDSVGTALLYTRPEFLPNASHFTYNARNTGSSTYGLRKVALRRVDAGLRVPFLKIITGGREALLAEIKNEVANAHEDFLPPLRQLVDRIEVYEQEPIYALPPGSDDGHSSSSENDLEFDDEDLEETDDEE